MKFKEIIEEVKKEIHKMKDEIIKGKLFWVSCTLHKQVLGK